MKRKLITTPVTKELDGDFQNIMRMTLQGGKDPGNFRDLIIPLCELVDNALDAGAESVCFTVKGNKLIVTDDGEGFPSTAALCKCFGDICNPLKDGKSTIGTYNFGHKMLFFTANAVEEKVVTYPRGAYGVEAVVSTNKEGRVQFTHREFNADVDERGTTITYTFNKEDAAKMLSDKNIREIKKVLQRIYGVNKNLRFTWDNRNFILEAEYYNASNASEYATILFDEPIRIGKKSYGRFQALVTTTVQGRPWLGRMAGITGKRIIEYNEALSKYFGNYSPNEQRLRVFIWFDNDILGKNTVSITNEKDAFSIHDDALLERIEALEKRAKKLYGEEMAKEKTKENFDVESWIQKQACIVIEDFTMANQDGRGHSTSNGTPSSGTSDSTGSSGDDSDSAEEAAKRNHGIRPFIQFSNSGPGRTFILDRDAKEVYINRDERLFNDLKCLRHQKQGAVPFRHLFNKWYVWRQKYAGNSDATAFLEECGIVRQK